MTTFNLLLLPPKMSTINLIFKRFKSSKQYYSLLGVSQNASSKEIKDNFHKLSKIYHPDNKETGDHEKFLQIREAYDAIKDANNAQEKYQEPSIYSNTRKDVKPIYRKQPLSMEHIQSVYRTLNREDQMEEPKFRMFEDHHYPNTCFNRFEYSRTWDSQKRVWIYKKRPDAADYQNRMKDSNKKLRYVIMTFMGVTMFIILNYKVNNWINN